MADPTIRSYENRESARLALERMLDEGYTMEQLRLIDPFDERQGSFADNDPVLHNRAVERKGSFADVEEEQHNRNVERQGSFGDADPKLHDQNTEPQGNFGTGMRELPDDAVLGRRLRDAGLESEAVDRCLEELRAGRVLLLISDARQVG